MCEAMGRSTTWWWHPRRPCLRPRLDLLRPRKYPSVCAAVGERRDTSGEGEVVVALLRRARTHASTSFASPTSFYRYGQPLRTPIDPSAAVRARYSPHRRQSARQRPDTCEREGQARSELGAFEMLLLCACAESSAQSVGQLSRKWSRVRGMRNSQLSGQSPLGPKTPESDGDCRICVNHEQTGSRTTAFWTKRRTRVGPTRVELRKGHD